MMQPAVPPIAPIRTSALSEEGGGWRTARDDNIVFFVDGCGSQHHRTFNCFRNLCLLEKC